MYGYHSNEDNKSVQHFKERASAVFKAALGKDFDCRLYSDLMTHYN